MLQAELWDHTRVYSQPVHQGLLPACSPGFTPSLSAFGYAFSWVEGRGRKSSPALSSGILLRRLASDPHLASVSHVVVDEVHERSLQVGAMWEGARGGMCVGVLCVG